MTAASLFRDIGLMADGPLPLDRPVPARGPGLFVVELSEPINCEGFIDCGLANGVEQVFDGQVVTTPIPDHVVNPIRFRRELRSRLPLKVPTVKPSPFRK